MAITRIISLAVAAAGIVLWSAVPALRGQDVAALAIIAVLLGIPHGTVDYLLPQGDHWRLGRRSIAWTLGLYVLAFLIGIGVVLIYPALAYFGILGLSVLHWGDGDAGYRRESEGQPPTRAGVVEIIAYGGTAVVSATFWPEHLQDVLATVAPGVADATRVPTMIGGGVVLCAMVVFAVRMAVRRRWLAVAEMVVLALLPILTPPLVYFGLYFGPWHSLRQSVRLVVDARLNRKSGTIAQLDSARILRMMAYSTVGVFVLILVTVALADRFSGRAMHFGAGDWMMATLTAVVAPHAIAVLRYDIWKRRWTASQGTNPPAAKA